MSEPTPIKSYKHDCLNVSWTRTTLMGMPKWTGKTHKNLHRELQATEEKLGVGEVVFPKEEHTD